MLMNINKHLHFILFCFFAFTGTIAILDYNFTQLIPYDCSAEITIYSYLSMFFVLFFLNPISKKVKIKS